METGTLEKFLVMYSSGIVPDLLRLYNNVHEYAQQGLIQSLEPFIENSSFRREDFVPILLERSLSYNGELYSIPFGISIAAFFVNVERFEEAGLTVPDETWRWEVEGREAAQRLTRINPDSGVHDYFFLGAFWDMNPIDAMIYSAGGEVFDADFNFKGDSNEVVAVLDFLHEMHSLYKAFPLTTDAVGPVNLINERASAVFSGSAYVSYLLHEELPFKWEIGLTPSFNGGRGTSLWPETPWTIPNGAPNAEAAWRVLEFIASPEGQELAVQLGLAIPPFRLDTMRTAFLQQYPDVRIMNIATLTTSPLTKPSFGTGLPANIRNTWTQTVRSVESGAKPARQAVEEVKPVLEALLREYLGR